MPITIRPPKTEKEFEDYYQLRWEVLRKPRNEPKGSEKDKLEETADHMAAFDSGKVVGCGRIHLNNPDEAKVRFMAIAEAYQNQGIGGLILDRLEEIARAEGAKYIILDAREAALNFYLRHGYKTIEDGHVLFGNIPHWRMRKELQ